MAPKLDERTRKELEGQIETLAASYTPQWRFQREHPDMGTVIGGLFAGMMEETIGRYNQMTERTRLHFLDLLGIEPLPAKKAEGYLTLHLAREDLPEAVVKAGTGVAAEREGESLILYETGEDVYVMAASVKLVTVPEESWWYLHFDREPGEGVISLLASMDQEENLPESGLWLEYSGQQGWEPMRAEDQTGGLCHRGLIRFIKPLGWKNREVLGEDGYWIRLYRDRDRQFPKGIVSLWGNAVFVQAREAGTSGNLSAGNTLKLTKSIGFVSGARNPQPLCGGTKEEERELAVTRGSARIRHQFRGVTPRDYEQLVYELFPDMERVRCFGGFAPSGLRCPGAVTVVALPANYLESQGSLPGIQEQIKVYLSKMAPGGLAERGQLFVIGPIWVRMQLRCELCVKTYGEVQRIQRKAEKAIAEFLDDARGNFDGNGWEMGEIPEYGQVKACILGIPGVCYVKQLRISYETGDGGQLQEVLLDQIKQYPWLLPGPGTVQVRAVVEGNYGDV